MGYDVQMPMLTLYTREPCPMCDELKEELQPFLASGACKLQMVNIATKENLKYLRLYRYEIPVLFLNGEFLCKHRLNRDLLEKSLKELKSL